MTNTELAWNIYRALIDKGAFIGTASVGIIEREIDRAEAERWIPVSEQLPGKSDEYLVAVCRKDVPGGWVWLKSFDPDAGRFLIGGERYFTVTHWQPLPEAPGSEAAE